MPKNEARECEKCEYLTIASGFYVCGSQCGKPANCGHPLCPCVQWDCDEDPETGEPIEPECETDEDAIIEGGRCWSYLSWLHAMHRERARNHDCEECLKEGKHTPAITDLNANKPYYLCEKCLDKLARGIKHD